MGRKRIIDTLAEMSRKQIVLHGEVLKMFNYEVSDRYITESELGREIIRKHYEKNPPIGFKSKG